MRLLGSFFIGHETLRSRLSVAGGSQRTTWAAGRLFRSSAIERQSFAAFSLKVNPNLAGGIGRDTRVNYANRKLPLLDPFLEVPTRNVRFAANGCRQRWRQSPDKETRSR